MVLSGLLDIWCQPTLSSGYIQNTACHLFLHRCHLTKLLWHILSSWVFTCNSAQPGPVMTPTSFHLSLSVLTFLSSLTVYLFTWRSCISPVKVHCAAAPSGSIKYLDGCLCRRWLRRRGGIIWETAAVAHLGVTDSRGRCAAGVAMEEGGT